ncbi:transposase [Salinibacillus xinjiangensis]|uniref:transposase n=1 Tax=Salinibacillus xinjiangensis TaxID=1229268 RepID=UPI001E3D08AE|nr:transposase [Salinibacillus xinjiangensis]
MTTQHINIQHLPAVLDNPRLVRRFDQYCKWAKIGDYVKVGIGQTTQFNRLYQFYDLVRSPGIREFKRAIETFQNWQKQIMNSFGFDLHNGSVEGINNQTKVMKRNAFGLKRFDRFSLKVLLHHQYKNIDVRVV